MSRLRYQTRISLSRYYDEYLSVTTIVVAFANGLTSKSFFRVLVEKSESSERLTARGGEGKRMEKKWKGEMEGSGKNSRSVMHAGLNRQRKICARVCARARLSERPRCPCGGMGENTRQNALSTNYAWWWIYNLSLLLRMKHSISI